MRVLVVDDENEVRSVVSRALERDGHAVTTARDLASARAAMSEGIELVVLDLRLPDGFGLELCRELREAGSATPVLILTAASQVGSRVEGLDAGADDFLAKPFAIAELQARVRALGRRGRMVARLTLKHGDLTLDFGTRVASRKGTQIAVTAREWAILDLLARHDGRVVSRGELLDGVWGDQSENAGSSLEVLIARLRRKLGAELIRTLRGEGYALEVRP
ncbi:MAG: response regulator transcription factor [Archangium sp.]